MPQGTVACRLSLVFFLLAAMPGCWIPVLANILEVKGWASLTDWAFVIPSLGAVVSPLFLGALADQRIRAERVLAVVLALNSLFTAAAFWVLAQGESPFWFLFFLSMKAILGAPTWSLLISVTLVHLTRPEQQFGGIRVWGTVGWLVAGVMVSVLRLDESAAVGLIACSFGLLGAGLSLTLPATPPQEKGQVSLLDALGFKTFRILKDRDTGTYFLAAFLFSIPLAAYYPYTAKFLKDLEVQQVAAALSIGQISEIGAMLLMGWFLRKIRVKWIFLIALLAGVLRYGLYLIPSFLSNDLPSVVTLSPVILGIFMHGICWTLFFESGRLFVDRRVEKGLRSQAQALLTVLTGGVATITGVLFAGWLYRWFVEGGRGGWNPFWATLLVFCDLGVLVMTFGYRVQRAEKR